jgi:hypothetical protein
MAEYIPVGTRVQIQAMEGLFLGTVVSFRDAYLEELNPPSLPNVLKPTEIIKLDKTSAWANDPKKIITLYAVKLDDPTLYRGQLNGDVAQNIYTFITPIEQNETPVQS